MHAENADNLAAIFHMDFLEMNSWYFVGNFIKIPSQSSKQQKDSIDSNNGK